MRNFKPSVVSSTSLVGNDGFLGIGNKPFAVPFEGMSLDTEDHCFILDVDKERLEKDRRRDSVGT